MCDFGPFSLLFACVVTSKPSVIVTTVKYLSPLFNSRWMCYSPSLEVEVATKVKKGLVGEYFIRVNIYLIR